jgi:enoyl-CoA hydratase/carnithine racemase
VYEEIIYEVKDTIATITLNRPDQLNAWTDTMGRELKSAVAAAEEDPQVVVIVLTGAGRGFCAGADMGGLQALSGGGAQLGGTRSQAPIADPGEKDMAQGFRGEYTYLMSLRKPIIAAINGPCAGMALPISLACDIRFASDKAVFTTAFARRGLIAEWGVAWLLPRVVGSGHAMDLLLSARRVDAAEAERIGLVNKVIPHEDFMKSVLEYAHDVAQNASPTSMKVIKRQVYESFEETLGESNEKAVRLMQDTFARPDFKEGVSSYMEKRPPKFPRV